MNAPPLVEIPRAALATWPALIPRVMSGELLGAVVRGAFDPTAMERLRERVASGALGLRPAEMRHFAGQQYGRTLVVAQDMEEYFAEAERFRMAFEAEGVRFEQELQELLGVLNEGCTAEPPRDDAGRRYGLMTIRVVRSGGGIDLHCERETMRFPTMVALSKQLDPATQLSFYVPLALPESGGELHVYHLRHEEGPGRALGSMERKAEATLRYVESHGVTVPRPGVGDLLIFDAGRHFHRVSAVGGAQERWTMGGFLARSRDGRRLHYWS